MTTEEAVRLLGAKRILQVLEDIAPRFSRVSHHFMSQEQYGHLRRDNIPAAMQVYWLELLYRARLAASTGLLRHQRWLDAVIVAASAGNFFAFAAALRALMESSADTHHALSSVPQTLADNIEVIRSAVQGGLQQPDECVLEADFIHFLYGRNTSGEGPTPPGHRTLNIVEYLRSVDRDEAVGIEECWRYLCQITHPSGFTVLRFLSTEPDGSVRLCEAEDSEVILNFCSHFIILLTFVISLPVMQSLLTLRVLNGVGVPELETKALPTYGLESTDAWQHIERRLRIH